MANKLRKVFLLILLFAGTASAQFGRTYWYPNADTLRPISPDFLPGASFFLADSALILKPQPPAVKTQRLYNQNDTLYWNGIPVVQSGAAGIGTLNSIGADTLIVVGITAASIATVAYHFRSVASSMPPMSWYIIGPDTLTVYGEADSSFSWAILRQ